MTQTPEQIAAGTRNADLIEGMDYLKVCYFCSGDGEYEQTYTAGCGGGYYQMKGRCSHCEGTGIKTINGGNVSRSHLMQIETRRRAILENQHERG